MKNTRKNRSNWSSNTKRFRKLILTSLLGLSVLPIFATTTSLGFTQTSKVSSIFDDDFGGRGGGGGWKPPGGGYGRVIGAAVGAGLGGFLAGRTFKKLEEVSSKVSNLSNLIKTKDFSTARYRLDEIWRILGEVEAEIEEFASEVYQLTDPSLQLVYIDRLIQLRSKYTHQHLGATKREIQLADAMEGAENLRISRRR